MEAECDWCCGCHACRGCCGCCPCCGEARAPPLSSGSDEEAAPVLGNAPHQSDSQQVRRRHGRDEGPSDAAGAVRVTTKEKGILDQLARLGASRVNAVVFVGVSKSGQTSLLNRVAKLLDPNAQQQLVSEASRVTTREAVLVDVGHREVDGERVVDVLVDIPGVAASSNALACVQTLYALRSAVHRFNGDEEVSGGSQDDELRIEVEPELPRGRMSVRGVVATLDGRQSLAEKQQLAAIQEQLFRHTVREQLAVVRTKYAVDDDKKLKEALSDELDLMHKSVDAGWLSQVLGDNFAVIDNHDGDGGESAYTRTKIEELAAKVRAWLSSDVEWDVL